MYPMKQNIIIMKNLLPNKERCIIFYLKGSKVARLVKGIDNPQNPPCEKVLKDTNFLMYGKKLKLDEDSKINIIKTLKLDFDLLRGCGITDYSILLGIYKKGNNKVLGERALIVVDDGTEFNIGVIDIFQEYNFMKAGERTIKSIFNKIQDFLNVVD